MINTLDQEQLFRLISEYLTEDIDCIAIGGTAMMFLGYKNATKDIDLVFTDDSRRKVFIQAIERIGYKEESAAGLYDEKRRKHINRPKIYSRGDERFDLFVKDIFGFSLKGAWDAFLQRHDFLGKKELIVKVLSKEALILLKSVTGREKDYEDIETIIDIEKDIDWHLIVSEAILQRKGNPWILHDLEETMQKLRKKAFIKKQEFDRIYKAEEMMGERGKTGR